MTNMSVNTVLCPSNRCCRLRRNNTVMNIHVSLEREVRIVRNSYFSFTLHAIVFAYCNKG